MRSPFSCPIRFFSHLFFLLETLVNQRLLGNETALPQNRTYEFPGIRLKQVTMAMLFLDGFVDGTGGEPTGGWSMCLYHHQFLGFYGVCEFPLH